MGFTFIGMHFYVDNQSMSRAYGVSEMLLFKRIVWRCLVLLPHFAAIADRVMDASVVK